VKKRKETFEKYILSEFFYFLFLFFIFYFILRTAHNKHDHKRENKLGEKYRA